MIINEISGSLYAWDLADEGIDQCLDNLQECASCNSAYLVGVMHHEKRPLHQQFYPHNPKRKCYYPEDSRIYWKPDQSCYEDTKIEPLTSDRDFLKDVDWLDLLIDEARDRGMKIGCEISHTILDSSVAEAEYEDVLQQNVYGETLGMGAGGSKGAGHLRRVIPCLNDENVRNYLLGLVEDLSANHDLDFIQSCLILFKGNVSEEDGSELERLLGTSLGGCFCDSCQKRAEEHGFDWKRMVEDTRRVADIFQQTDLERLHESKMLEDSNMTATNLLLENPGFHEWLQFRVDSVTELFHDIHDKLQETDPTVEFRYNNYLDYPELDGLDFESAFEWVDSVRESDYSEQAGDLTEVEHKRERLLKVRRATDKSLLAALGVRPDATPEIIRKGTKIAVDCGVDGITLGHYDGATMARLEAAPDGLEEAEANIPDIAK